jgi:hypothetical protein
MYFVGVILMAGCGTFIAHRLALDGWSIIYVAGFAVGIALLGQAPAVELRSRLAALESKLGSQIKGPVQP